MSAVANTGIIVVVNIAGETNQGMVKAGFRFSSWSLVQYLGKEVLISFLIGSAVFLAIMLAFQAIRLSEFIIMQQVPFWNVCKLSFFLLQSFLSLAFPISFLFAVLLGISRANSENEILAFQVNGVSIWQLYIPVFVLSILLSFICFYLSMFSVPRGNRGFELLVAQLGAKSVLATLRAGVFTEGFYGMVIFAEQVDPKTNEMSRVFIFDERDKQHPYAITAQRAKLAADADRGVITLRLAKGAIHVDKPEAEGIQQRINFNLYDINLELVTGANVGRGYSLPSLDYYQIRDQMEAKNQDVRHRRVLAVELHRRISLAFSCVVFGALGFFISIMSKRGIRSSAIVLCLIVGVVYWLSYLVANALAIQGWVAPWLGIWLPNLIFGLVPFYCYYRYRWGV